MVRHLGAFGVAGVVLLAPLLARASTPTDTLRDVFARANVVIQAPEEQLSVEERIARIRELADAVFDVRHAAAEALGNEWQARTPGEQVQFTQVFGDTLQRAYLSLVGPKVKVRGGVGVTFLGETVTGDAAVVRTTLATRANGTLAVDYRLTRTGATWAVVDALVDGVSLVGTYRAQFSRVLQGYSYAELVEMMRAVAPESPRPAVAMASEAVHPGDDVRVLGAPIEDEDAFTGRPATDGAASPPPLANEPLPAAGAAPVPSATERLARAPTPAPAATPQGVGALGGGRFWVEIGAFGSPDLAAKVLAQLSDPAIAIFTPPSGGHPESLTRVLVGPFPDRGVAAAKARQLEAAGYPGVVAEE